MSNYNKTNNYTGIIFYNNILYKILCCHSEITLKGNYLYSYIFNLGTCLLFGEKSKRQALYTKSLVSNQYSGNLSGDSALVPIAEVSLSRCIGWHLFETLLLFTHIPPECGRL